MLLLSMAVHVSDELAIFVVGYECAVDVGDGSCVECLMYWFDVDEEFFCVEDL